MNIDFLEQKKKSMNEVSRWFHHCTAKQIPMVKAMKRTTLGDVDWDYITLNPNDEDFLSTQESWIKNELCELLKYYECNKTQARIGSYTGIVKNLPVERVSDFATDVCNTLSEAFQQHKLNNA